MKKYNKEPKEYHQVDLLLNKHCDDIDGTHISRFMWFDDKGKNKMVEPFWHFENSKNEDQICNPLLADTIVISWFTRIPFDPRGFKNNRNFKKIVKNYKKRNKIK